VTLDQYIIGLIAALQQCDPQAYHRICHVVGERSARIRLDAECVYVRMRNGVLDVAHKVWGGWSPDGEGATDSATVGALLRGDLEVSEAILNGSLTIHGDIEQINRMFHAIEILLDAAPRCPLLQRLSQQFTSEGRRCEPETNFPPITWYPFPVNAAELDFLAQHGLLPHRRRPC